MVWIIYTVQEMYNPKFWRPKCTGSYNSTGKYYIFLVTRRKLEFGSIYRNQIFEKCQKEINVENPRSTKITGDSNLLRRIWYWMGENISEKVQMVSENKLSLQ